VKRLTRTFSDPLRNCLEDIKENFILKVLVENLGGKIETKKDTSFFAFGILLVKDS